MLASGDREASRRSLYSGTAALRLCRRLASVRRRCRRALCALAAAPAAPTSSLRCSRSGDADAEATGSVSRPRPSRPARIADAAEPPETDLAYARAAAADALARGGKDTSVPWQNPHTGAGGNITPLAASYSEGGFPCRDFLASYVHAGAQAWLQGAACRTGRGKWEVKSLKPLKRG